MITIGVCARSLSAGQQALLAALGDAFGVAFDPRPVRDAGDAAGLLVLGADRAKVSQLEHVPQRCFVVPDSTELRPCGTSSTVTFGSGDAVEVLLRGRTVISEDVVDAKGLPEWLTDRVP